MSGSKPADARSSIRLHLMIGLTVDDVNEWPARIRAVDVLGVQKAAQRLIRRNAVSIYLLPGAAK